MKRYALPFVFLLLLVSTARSQEVPAWSEPAISPDGRPIGESYAGKDSQLDAAVQELLSEPRK